MLASQYKIVLSGDYDMEIIKNRVRNNGNKTDGFHGLSYKFYLITEKGKHGNLQNSYCPFYLWSESSGLDKFLFDGFYDNIIGSFGWQRINIGIPLLDTTKGEGKDYKYLYQIADDIVPQRSLKDMSAKLKKELSQIGPEYIAIYNPDKWKYEAFFFLKDLHLPHDEKGVIFTILHISEGK